MDSELRIAIVGYGYWGVNLARNIASAKGARLLGIADSSPDRRLLGRTHYPGIEVWSSLEEALEDPLVDAVVLAVPAHVHFAAAMAVLRTGRHVLVEKPLAMVPGEAIEIAREAERRSIVAMVGHTFLYSPPVTLLRNLIAQGDLGNLQYLYSQRLSLGRIRRDCNALWNFAPHDVSIMLHLLGEKPVEVSGRSFSLIGEGIGDVFFATIVFESGVGANLHVSWIDPRKVRLMTVVGKDKMAIYDDVSPDQKIAIYDAGVARSDDRDGLTEYESLGEFQWKTRAGDIVIPRVALREPLLNEIEDFARCCVSGEKPVSDAWHGVEVVKTLGAIDESAAAGGRPVEIAW